MAGTTWKTFVPGTKIKSSEVNANFDWLEGSFVPMLNGAQVGSTYDLGTTTAMWRHAYISGNLYLDTAASYRLAYTASSMQFYCNNAKTLQLIAGGTSQILASDFSIDTGKKIYLDGGGDTYMVESSANYISFYCGSVGAGYFGPVCGVATNFNIEPTKRLYFDGGGDTYITEQGANQLYFYTNGSPGFYINSAQVCGVLSHLRIESGNRLYLDGGTDTYIMEGSANIQQFFCDGTKILQLAKNDNCAIYTSNLLIDSGKGLYFDGGGDTFMRHATSNTLEIVCGGSTITTYSPGTGQLFNSNVTVSDANKFIIGTTTCYIQFTDTSVWIYNGNHANYCKMRLLANAYVGAGGVFTYNISSHGYSFNPGDYSGAADVGSINKNDSLTQTINFNFQDTACRMGGGSFNPTSDGAVNLGLNSTNDWKNIYYHSLNAHCFDTVKTDITNSVPAKLFESLPKTGKYKSKNVRGESPNKKYGFYVEESDTKAKPYVNTDASGNKSISIHGLIAQLTECVKNLDARLAALEK